MLYISDGIPKSGSTFLYAILKELIHCQSNRCWQSLLNDRYVGSESFCNSPISFFSKEIRPLLHHNNYIIKTHMLPFSRLANLDGTCDFSQFIRIFCSLRNPYDTIIALTDQAKLESERFGSSGYRRGFAKLDTEAKAADYVLNCMRNAISWKRSNIFSKSIIFVDYSEITECRSSVDWISKFALDDIISNAEIVNLIKSVDTNIRAKKTFGEFNKGISGRGQHLRMNYLDPDLCARLDQSYTQLLKYCSS